MLIIISFISLMVQFYSIGYMAKDPHTTRFFSFLSLFSFFMIILVYVLWKKQIIKLIIPSSLSFKQQNDQDWKVHKIS